MLYITYINESLELRNARLHWMYRTYNGKSAISQYASYHEKKYQDENIRGVYSFLPAPFLLVEKDFQNNAAWG